MKFSSLDLFSVAFSTRARTREAADSVNGRSTLQVITPFTTMTPLSRVSPTVTARGIDSPVIDEVSISVEPEIISQSRGTRSPARIMMVAPTSTSSASTVSSSPSTMTVASSGQISIKDLIDLRDFFTAVFSKVSPMRKKSITATPSLYSPRIIAPMDATDIKNFSSRRSPRRMPRTALINTSSPATRRARI